MDEIRLFVRDYCSARPEEYPYFDLRKQEGLMRTLILRTTSTGEIMVVVVFYRENEAARIALLTALQERFPQITALLYVINGKCNDTIGDQEIHCFYGREYIEEEMEGLRFRIGPQVPSTKPIVDRPTSSTRSPVNSRSSLARSASMTSTRGRGR